MSVDGQTNQPCCQCRLPIPKGAKLCSHCESYQDIRRNLPTSSTVLALLIALLSVGSSTFPMLRQAFHKPHAEVEISSPVIDDQTVQMVVTNLGDRPGVIFGGTLESKVWREIPLTLANVGSAFVPAGSKQIALRPMIRMHYGDAAKLARDPRLRIGADETRLRVIFVEPDGSYSDRTVPLPAGAFRGLLAAHADRCSSERAASIIAACRSSGGSGGDY